MWYSGHGDALFDANDDDSSYRQEDDSDDDGDTIDTGLVHYDDSFDSDEDYHLESEHSSERSEY